MYEAFSYECMSVSGRSRTCGTARTLYVLVHMCPHTSVCPSAVSLARAALRGLSMYWYICVLILVHVCQRLLSHVRHCAENEDIKMVNLEWLMSKVFT